MSGLFAALNNSVTALQAQSVAVNVTGKNLSNVNNPSYSREQVTFGTGTTVVTPNGAESLGVTASVDQVRDTLLDGQVVSETALSSYYNTLQAAYQRAQAGLGENLTGTSATSSSSSSVSQNGVGAALDDYFNAFQTFAASPTDIGARQALYSAASVLTDRIQQSDQGLSQVQTDLTGQVSSNVTDANLLLKQIADLNTQIGRVEINAPGSAVDLRDQRQAAIEKLAAIMPVTTAPQANGELQVSSVDGSGNVVPLVSLGTVTGSIAFNGTQITGGASGTVLALKSGSMQGALDARDGAIQSLRDQLNNVAKQLVTSVNGVYNPGGASTNFFNASGTTAGTIALDSSLSAANVRASNGGAAGDNTVALAIANLANQSFSTSGSPPDQIDGTLSSYYSGAVTSFGQALNTANESVDNQTTISNLVLSQRNSVSGVNLDEEMANLIKYQRAFQASSQVFKMVDNLLDTVVNNLNS